MDNEEIVKIDDVEYHFKLKSQSIVELEKVLGKNIFEIFADMSFTSMRKILSTCLISPTDITPDDLMDVLIKKYTLLEIANDLIRNIAIKSGLVKQENVELTEEERKN